jgi:Domain of unknown function (DUF6538)
MAFDQRYMKQGRGPHSTWFFVYNIPKNLRGYPRFMTSRGKPMTKITESLETTDSEKARERRNVRQVYWDRQFRMLRDGPSEADIREEAVEVYRATLKAEAERPGKWLTEERQLAGSHFYPQLLDEAIEEQAAGEIADFCRKTGQTLQPGTEPYRKVGVEFIKAKIAAGGREAWLPLPDGREICGKDQYLLPKVEPPIPAEPKPITDPPLPKKLTETFSEAFERYLATALDGTGEQSIADYRRKVKVFIDKIGDLPLSKITDHMAVDFLDDHLLHERKVSPRTRNGYAMLFSAVYKCAIRRKKATANPFEYRPGTCYPIC